MAKLVTLVLLLLAQISDNGSAPKISGRIITDEGQPVANAVIRLHRKEYRDGVERLVPVVRVTARTNGEGEFQIGIPAPGKYYLSVVPSGQQTIGRYYPGTVDSSDAEPIHVTREDVHIPDFVLTPVTVFTIRGSFVQPADLRPRSGSFGVRRLDKATDNDFPAVRLGVDGDPDRFEVRVPSPGTYGLSFGLMTDNADYLGTAIVEVHGNVDGVTIVPARGANVVVRATLDSNPVTFSQIHIDPSDAMFRPSIARPNSEGVLTLQGVYPTRYVVGVDGLPPNLYISRIRFNGLESTIPAFTPAQNVSDGVLDIFLAKGSEIDGKAFNEDGRSPAGAVVALIPEDRSRHDLYQDSKVGEDGSFHFEGVAPGKYRLFAWDEVPAGAFLNADFMKPFEDRGSDVVVESDSHQETSVKIIGN